MSTPRPSMKLLVESGIVPRAPNQRPLTWNSLGPKLSRNFSLRKGMYSHMSVFSPFPLCLPDRGHWSHISRLDPNSSKESET
ncbi:unnamed protein product [Nezara viridula]|uniref:Uncharacterized protein n=1 Tax=Nezara viridula TaxID=85310 RepID=A0A9P0HKX1_NEZVI|nr:unnamed protein product [Nezara viridula]